MGTALNIRQDYTADDLRQLARRSRDADWSRRLLALSVIYEGGSRSHVASISGVGLQIIRDWVERFNQHGPTGLKTGKAKGREPLLNDKQRKALIEAVEKGPVRYLDGVVRWRLVDLVQWLWQEHRISVSRQTLDRHSRIPSRHQQRDGCGSWAWLGFHARQTGRKTMYSHSLLISAQK